MRGGNWRTTARVVSPVTVAQRALLLVRETEPDDAAAYDAGQDAVEGRFDRPRVDRACCRSVSTRAWDARGARRLDEETRH